MHAFITLPIKRRHQPEPEAINFNLVDELLLPIDKVILKYLTVLCTLDDHKHLKAATSEQS